jgi:O-methyltransferase
MVREKIDRLLRPLRLQLRPSRAQRRKPNLLVSDDDAALMDRFASYTMTDRTRQYALIRAMRYLDAAALEGDFVECGVWRGGSTMIAKACRTQPIAMPRRFYLYDTFEGMTEPTPEDYTAKDGVSARDVLAAAKKHKNARNVLTTVSVAEVKAAFEREGLFDESVVFKVGPVEKTLLSELPEKISLLRLDTDWYASTAIELEKLYPRLVRGGVIIIDDYTTWAGARKAADEYFATRPILLVPTGGSGVIGVKAA